MSDPARPHPLFDLSGRIALVTGSSRGIGLAMARALASVGARVVINGRDAAALDAVARRLRAEGTEAAVAPFDVTDEAAVEAAIERVEREVGPLDVLVNNSGINVRRPMLELATADFERVVATNLTAAFVVGRAAARRMVARRRGKIVNVCSINSELGRASIAPYVASKGGLRNLTRAMAVEWAPHGLQVNGLGPGYFETDLTAPLVADPAFDAWLRQRVPMGRWGQVDELAGATIFLASAASDFMTGQVVYVDGGLTASV